MGTKKQADEILISAILEGDKKTRSNALESIYSQYYPSVRNYILNNSGGEEEAQDIFQEGVVAFYHNVEAGKFKGASSISSYLYSICRNIWLMRLRRMSHQVPLEHERAIPEPVSDESIDSAKLDRLLDELSPDCRQLLIAYYYKKCSMSEIKDMFDLNSEQIAKTKKYRCMKKLIALVKARGLSRENFKM